MPDFTCRLKQFRLAKGLTQEQLASAVGVRRETIMRLEKAPVQPFPEAGRGYLPHSRSTDRGDFYF